MDIMNFEEKKDLEVNKLEIKENLFDMQKLILRLKNLIKIISEEQKNFYKIEVSSEINDFYIGNEKELEHVLIKFFVGAVKYLKEAEMLPYSEDSAPVLLPRTSLRILLLLLPYNILSP